MTLTDLESNNTKIKLNRNNPIFTRGGGGGVENKQVTIFPKLRFYAARHNNIIDSSSRSFGQKSSNIKVCPVKFSSSFVNLQKNKQLGGGDYHGVMSGNSAYNQVTEINFLTFPSIYVLNKQEVCACERTFA